jgi:hypothetical protein
MNTRYRVDSETIRLRIEDGDGGEMLLEVTRAELARGAGSGLAARSSSARALRVGPGGSSSSSSSSAAVAGDAGHGRATTVISERRRHGLRSSD